MESFLVGWKERDMVSNPKSVETHTHTNIVLWSEVIFSLLRMISLPHNSLDAVKGRFSFQSSNLPDCLSCLQVYLLPLICFLNSIYYFVSSVLDVGLYPLYCFVSLCYPRLVVQSTILYHFVVRLYYPSFWRPWSSMVEQNSNKWKSMLSELRLTGL